MSTNRIRFYYYKGNKIGNWLIRARFGSEFSHVGILLGDQFYEATFSKGVSKVHELDARVPHLYEDIYVTEESYKAVLAFMDAQVGLKYDFEAIFGFIIGSKKQDKTKWFCSELGRKVFELGVGCELPLKNLMSPGAHRVLVMGYNEGVFNSKET